MGFISTFMLPKNVDFNAALQAQTCAARVILESLQKVCVDNDATALATLSTTFDKARVLKTKNMKELLDVFITPYDKESIYRIITQLDWIALSAKHFLLEFEAYGILPIREYQPIFRALVKMMALLEQGVSRLPKKSARAIAHNIDHIYEKYDQVVAMSTESMAGLLKQDDFKRIIMHRELLAQLKEVAKRIQITANSLEDMAIKVT